ncbi:hypothetical protein [Georgenia sp. AZ-5]
MSVLVAAGLIAGIAAPSSAAPVDKSASYTACFACWPTAGPR